MGQPRWEQLEEADWLFRKMIRRFVKERDKITVQGISLPGMMILHKIIEEGPQRLGDLAEQLDFTSGAITAIVDKLEAAGFTERTRREGDRRSVWLVITPRGREMYECNRSIGTRCITLLFEGFDGDELTAQIYIFKRIISNLERFSEDIMKLAHENAAVPVPAENGQKQDQKPGSSRFLSY